MSFIENKIKYIDLITDFQQNSEQILPSKLSQYQLLITLILALLSFASVALTLINRKANFATYLTSASVASVSIALTSIYACNFFGVYI
ncbi:hypothetical protein METBIDRAFT_33484 [Metschnikowia bicuspidata var. bicuspidata NRRL YB-4993]|uniref:Dolichyl-diphosphooligosaccharide-protein glycosyltransferase subunit OST5 n=1 Tax=Metschnikowia bicuspidata var. bicuspidata NRRL YB-4993 TaxID=869754 RepID=A0A1A0H5R3_9ASCO|nr:hypothetical protein METBIDRAFT_33484 [Metschnikowia bicuspidata var. bicuspidata NRRL YB-4993]OBA19295.1 hypothetical protein METBIDRAFT_33484 [Metschnikowia bicuspidata var. bicuspidata NRRL YB-4993]